MESSATSWIHGLCELGSRSQYHLDRRDIPAARRVEKRCLGGRFDLPCGWVSHDVPFVNGSTSKHIVNQGRRGETMARPEQSPGPCVISIWRLSGPSGARPPGALATLRRLALFVAAGIAPLAAIPLCGSPWPQPRNPARHVGPKALVLRAECLLERRFFDHHHPDMKKKPE